MMKRLFWGILILVLSYFSDGAWGSDFHPFRIPSVNATTANLQQAGEIIAASVASSVEISGPSTVMKGQCTAFTITALDHNGQPLKLRHNQRVTLSLVNPASLVFAAKSSCSRRQNEFVIKAHKSSATFYVRDSAVESASVQPILNPHSSGSIKGPTFTMEFVADSTPTPTLLPTPTPTLLPTPTPTSTLPGTPTPTPSPGAFGIQYDACWYDYGGNAYQALDFQLARPATLILQGELYTGSGCNLANWDDQLNDTGAAYSFGTYGYVFWFTHRANITDVSVIWSFNDTSGNQLWSSGCEDYLTAPPC